MIRKFSIEDLEMLATWLDRVADVHDAKAKESIAHGSATKETVKVITGKRDKAAHYAWTAREAATRLRVREKRGAFVPPTLEEVKQFARENDWPIADAESWFDHFQSNRWKVSGKAPMSDWRAAARNGKRRSEQRGQSAMRTKPTGDDHPRWAAWLRERKLPYGKQANALSYMHEEFDKWLAGNP